MKIKINNDKKDNEKSNRKNSKLSKNKNIVIRFLCSSQERQTPDSQQCRRSIYIGVDYCS